MAGETTLSVAIDASEAKRGAAEFVRAVDDIKRNVAEMMRAVDHGSNAFRSMRLAGARGSNTNEPAMKTFTVGGGFKTATTTSFLMSKRDAGLAVGIAGAGISLYQLLEHELEKSDKRRTDRTRLIEKADSRARLQTIIAQGSTDPRIRDNAEREAAKSFQELYSLEKEIVGPLIEELQRRSNSFAYYQEQTGRNVYLNREGDYYPGVRFLQQVEKITEKKFEDARAKLEALGESAAYAAPNRILKPGSVLGSNPSVGAGGNQPATEFIEGVIRDNEQLNQFKILIEDGTSLLKEQKDAQDQVTDAISATAEIRQRSDAEHLDSVSQINAAMTETQGPLADLIRELEEERRQLTMTDDEREISTRLLEIEARLKAAGVDVSDELRSSLERELQAIQNLRKARDEAAVEKQRQEEQGRKRQQDADAEAKRRADAVEASMDQIRGAAKDAFKDVIKGTESVGDAFKKLADRITDILLNLALDELLKPNNTGFSDLFGTIFGSLGSIFGGGNAAVFTGGAPGAATVGGMLKLPHGSPFHQGGIVGRDGGLPRPIAANVNTMPHFHGGGIAGLAADEVPIIARRGEEVLTRHDPRHRDNLGLGGGGGVVVNVSFPNARNTNEARQAGSEIAAKTAAAAQRGMARKGLG